MCIEILCGDEDELRLHARRPALHFLPGVLRQRPWSVRLSAARELAYVSRYLRVTRGWPPLAATAASEERRELSPQCGRDVCRVAQWEEKN